MKRTERKMFDAIVEFVSNQQGDSAEYLEKVRALAVGVAIDYKPARLYMIRIDNWFGPKWMHFAGKFTVGKRPRGLPTAAIGVHKIRLHVPPFIPQRVVAERVFVGTNYDETVVMPPLHIECPSMQALTRRIEDIDKDAAFIWFSSKSAVQKRGAVMVYLPFAFDATAHRRGLRDCGAFYVGLSQRENRWEPAMLRGVSRGEVTHLEESSKNALGLHDENALVIG
jgi:hypothetical protein